MANRPGKGAELVVAERSESDAKLTLDVPDSRANQIAGTEHGCGLLATESRLIIQFYLEPLSLKLLDLYGNQEVVGEESREVYCAAWPLTEQTAVAEQTYVSDTSERRGWFCRLAIAARRQRNLQPVVQGRWSQADQAAQAGGERIREVAKVFSPLEGNPEPVLCPGTIEE